MSEIFLMVTAGIRCWYLVGGGQTRCSAPPYCTGRPPRYKYPASAVNSTQAETPRSRQRNIHSSLGTLRSVGETGIKQKQQLPYYVSPGKVRVLRGHGLLSLCTRASRQGCTRTSVWVTALHQPRLPTPGLLRCSLPLGHPPHCPSPQAVSLPGGERQVTASNPILLTWASPRPALTPFSFA